MENKQLQLAKDTIAKDFLHSDWESLYIHYQEIEISISDEIINKVAIEYHRLMSEDDGIEQRSEIFTRSGSILATALDIESQMNDFIKNAKPNIISMHNSYENGIRTMVVIYKELPQPPK